MTIQDKKADKIMMLIEEYEGEVRWYESEFGRGIAEDSMEYAMLELLTENHKATEKRLYFDILLNDPADLLGESWLDLYAMYRGEPYHDDGRFLIPEGLEPNE